MDLRDIGDSALKQEPQTSRRPAPRTSLFFVGVLILCLGLKIRHNHRDFFTNIDGGLYTDIAEHVRDGHGLVTDISPYHHGYPSFPHPTGIYPIWPLLYGYLSRMIPLPIVGIWAPTLGYFVALVLAYLWACGLTARFRLLDGRKEPDEGVTVGRPPIRSSSMSRAAGSWIEAARAASLPGLALMLFLGLNRNFFQFTSLPYTEGLAYALLFGALWRFNKIGRSRSLAHAIEIGAWLGALMLVRSQFIVVVLAALISLAWQVLQEPHKIRWLRLGTVGLVFLALMGIQLYRISQFIPQKRLRALFRYDLAQTNDLLSPVATMFPTQGLTGLVKDRLSGVAEAFLPGSEWSYSRSYYALPYALPVVMILSFAHWRNRCRRKSQGLGSRAHFLIDPDVVFLLALSAGSLLSLHLMHLDIHLEWHFQSRQGLLALVPFFLCWLFVLSRKSKIWFTLSLAVALGTAVPSLLDCWQLVRTEKGGMASQRLNLLARWLTKQAQRQGPLVFVVPEPLPQLLAPKVPGGSFHWVYKGTTEDELKTLFEVLGADFLVLQRSPGLAKLPFERVRQAWFESYFEPVARVPGFLIMAKRGGPGRPKAHSPSSNSHL